MTDLHDETGALRTSTSSSTVVGYYDDYATASAAVDELARDDVPVEHLAIVGEGVQFVEDVVAKRTLGRSLIDGAIAGGMVGLLTGVFFAWLDWLDPTVERRSPILVGLLAGILIGAVVAAVWHLLRLNGTRVSVVQLRARRYRIEADDAVTAARVARHLAGLERR